MARSPALASVQDMQDWKTFTETLAHIAIGWSAGDPARKFAEIMRRSVSPATLSERWGPARRAIDATEHLPQIRAPTLVLHRQNCPLPPLDVAQRVASAIADARLVVLEGDAVAPYLGDAVSVVSAIDDFLSEGGGEEPTDLPSGTAIILFADIADSTALTERLGDAAFRGKARGLDGALRTIIHDNAGTPIEGKLLGDGVLAVFTSARQAIEAALACGRSGDDAGLPLHLGLHAGDVIREENNVYGGAVNIAARISGLSAPGEVLVSDTVRGLARTSAGVAFEDRGEQALKGVGEPVRAWAVREAAAP